MSETKYRAIDYHCNLFTPDAIRRRYYEGTEAVRAIKRAIFNRPRVKGFTPDEFIRYMDKLGIEKGLVPAWQWASYLDGSLIWDESVELVYSAIKEYPKRLFGLVGIDPRKRMEGVKQLERAIKDYGFRGAHLHTYGFGLPINHSDYFPLYTKCAELDAVVVIQTGSDTAQVPIRLAKPELIDDIAISFPTLRIVACHTGWPWVEEAICMAHRYENVFIGTAGYQPKYWTPSLVHFINSWGKGKVMWGTSYIAVDHKEGLDQIDQLGLKDDAKHELIYGTAARVFKI